MCTSWHCISISATYHYQTAHSWLVVKIGFGKACFISAIDALMWYHAIGALSFVMRSIFGHLPARLHHDRSLLPAWPFCMIGKSFKYNELLIWHEYCCVRAHFVY